MPRYIIGLYKDSGFPGENVSTFYQVIFLLYERSEVSVGSSRFYLLSLGLKFVPGGSDVQQSRLKREISLTVLKFISTDCGCFSLQTRTREKEPRVPRESWDEMVNHT